ncbi:MAG: DUF998 domain-containing protein [Thermoplasmataceae archaeon]
MKDVKSEDMKMAGFLLFVGVVQFFLFMLISEAIYPGYSVSGNYISDLGVGETAYIFNSSIILFGVFIILSALLIRKLSLTFIILIVLAGIGAIGVGSFPETTGNAHLIASFIVFLMSSLAPFFLLTKVKSYYAIGWAVLGSIGLISLILYAFGIYLGLGNGGMERMIAYPNLLWALTFGGWLMGKSGY